MQIDSVSWNMQLLFVDHDDFWEKKTKLLITCFCYVEQKLFDIHFDKFYWGKNWLEI